MDRKTNIRNPEDVTNEDSEEPMSENGIWIVNRIKSFQGK